MKERFNLIVSNIKRLVSNEEILYRLYVYVAIFSVVVIGFVGIISSSRNLASNIKLVIEVVNTNKKLAAKVVELKDDENSLNNVGSNIFFLDYYIPDIFNIQNYMIDFVFASGDTGFLISRMTPVKESSGTVDVYVSMIGIGKVVNLVSALESLYRVSEIQELRVVKGTEFDTLSMTLRTYIMEKQ